MPLPVAAGCRRNFGAYAIVQGRVLQVKGGYWGDLLGLFMESYAEVTLGATQRLGATVRSGFGVFLPQAMRETGTETDRASSAWALTCLLAFHLWTVYSPAITFFKNIG